MFKDCQVSCGLAADEMQLLNKLITDAVKPPQSVFKKKNEMGSRLFDLVQDQVWINQDLLWVSSEDGELSPYDIADAIDLWIEILATRISKSTDAHSLRVKAHKIFSLRVERSGFELVKDQTFEYLLWRRANGTDQLVMRDPALQMVEVSPLIDQAISCQSLDYSLQIFSPAWMYSTIESTKALMTLNFGVKWTCQGRKYSSVGRAVVITNLNQKNWVFDLSTLFVHVDGRMR